MADDFPHPPDGVTDDHMGEPRWYQRHASPISMVVLLALLGAAFAGLLGGHPNTTLRDSSPAAHFAVNTPEAIRNGEFFETRILVTPRRRFSDLTVAATPSLWRDITVNTTIPAPADESFREGAFRFSYGERDAGESLEVKIDSQINPSLFGANAGVFQLFDGDELVAEVPVEMRILP